MAWNTLKTRYTPENEIGKKLGNEFPHFFRRFFPRTFLKIKAFLKEKKKEKDQTILTLVVALLSSSKLSLSDPISVQLDLAGFGPHI